jgi:hypothetical protein
MRFGSDFLDITPKAKATKAKINGTTSSLKTLCIRGHSQQIKKATYRMEKIFANYISDKRLISKIYKECLQLVANNKNNSIKK